MSAVDYIEMRHRAAAVPPSDFYCLEKGECNPSILEKFFEMMKKGDVRPMVVWEPFAGHTRERSVSQDIAFDYGVVLISHDIAPSDPRVVKAESTTQGPGTDVGGLFFHPPYFGSGPQSNEKRRELSRVDNKMAYEGMMAVGIQVACKSLVDGGVVCAVGREYRHLGEIYSMPELYIREFRRQNGLRLVDV